MVKEINTTKKNDEIDLIQLVLKLWSYRKFVIIFTAIVTLVGIIYALIATPYFEAKVTLYQIKKEKSSSSNLTAIASQFGFGSIGNQSEYDLGDLIKSRKIGEKIIYRKWDTEKYDSAVNLIEFWEIKSEIDGLIFENAFKKLNDMVSYSENDETGLITISVTNEEPGLAADIANTYTELLNDYIKTEQKTSSKENISYIEDRLSIVKSELKETEEALKTFQEKNREIFSSPELQLEQSRLQRKVLIKQEVYLTLEKERELALIELVKETPVINILDKAVKPELRSKPKRKRIVIISGFIGGILSIFIVIIIEIIKVMKANYNFKEQQ